VFRRNNADMNSEVGSPQKTFQTLIDWGQPDKRTCNLLTKSPKYQ
jgi:hypothetical protein